MLCNIKGGSYSISRTNEDAFGYDAQCAWVLDGSTGLNGKRLVAEEGSSDAQWYAAAFSDYLKSNLPTKEGTLPEIFSHGVRTVWAEFERQAGGSVKREDVPCCVGVSVRIKDGFLEYISIGDCCLLVRYKDGKVTEYLDTRHCALDQNTMRLAVQLSEEEGLPISQCRPQILPELRRVRMTVNTPEGYIALADDPDAILQAKTGRIPVSQIRDVCMISDGFGEYYNMFRLADGPEEFMDAVKKNQPGELFDRLLEAQKTDPDYKAYPRFKLSDDATLLYFSL